MRPILTKQGIEAREIRRINIPEPSELTIERSYDRLRYRLARI
jgi:hypothetical protein